MTLFLFMVSHLVTALISYFVGASRIAIYLGRHPEEYEKIARPKI